MDRKCADTVLVTGFGPFGRHTVNASWEAVKQLEKLCSESKELENIKLVTVEVPVAYEIVSTLIPQLWKEHNPLVVLHVGVHAEAECLRIENQAHSTGYEKLDITEKIPTEIDISPCVLRTNFDVDEICNAVNTNSGNTGCKACMSENAGRFLCEYTFFHSLSQEPSKTIFVHVPDFNKYSTSQTAKGLFDILRFIVGRCKK